MRIGNVVTLVLPRGVVVWRVTAIGERRGPASEAAGLYIEISGDGESAERPLFP